MEKRERKFLKNSNLQACKFEQFDYFRMSSSIVNPNDLVEPCIECKALSCRRYSEKLLVDEKLFDKELFDAKLFDEKLTWLVDIDELLAEFKDCPLLPRWTETADFGVEKNAGRRAEELSPMVVTSTSKSLSDEDEESLWTSILLSRLEDEGAGLAMEVTGGSQMLWVNLCLRKSQFRLKTFLHWLHSYGLWSVWVRRWVLRFDLWLKLLLQIGHLWGDSSICRILWTAKVLDWQKPFPHSPH